MPKSRQHRHGNKRWGGGSYLKRWRYWWFVMARCGGQRWLQAVLLLLLPLHLLFFFFSVFFLFLSFSPLFPLFSTLSSLFCALLLYSLCLPCIYRKNRADTWIGRSLCSRPTTARGGTSPPFLQHVGGHGQLSKWVSLVGVFLSFLEEEKLVKTGEQNFLLPLFSVRPGKKKGYNAVQNGTVLSSLPFVFLNSV